MDRPTGPNSLRLPLINGAHFASKLDVCAFCYGASCLKLNEKAWGREPDRHGSPVLGGRVAQMVADWHTGRKMVLLKVETESNVGCPLQKA